MKKILVIEDNEAIRLNTAEILELSNYMVYQAENGKVGVASAMQHRPDLIICDIMMPELDGYGVLHAIQRNEETKHTPFIFLTAKNDRVDQRKGMELGADDYLTKPFDGTELLNAVSSRLKKFELLKNDMAPRPESINLILQASSASQALSALVEGRNINKYKKKQLIYSEGNHPSRLYYVIKGKVKTYRSNDEGKELVTELYTAGDFVGHIALLERSTYKDTAEAMEETELAIIPRDDIDQLIATSPEVSRKFIQLLAKNVSEKELHLLKLAYNSLRKKVADALLTVRSKYQQSPDETFEIDISRESLATMAGTATESLIRTLSDFKSERLIDIRDGKIRIIDPGKLEKMIN